MLFQINQWTQVIVDVNWTEEEIYLVLKTLFNNFSKELGPAIEHLGSTALKVTFVLEVRYYVKSLQLIHG